MLPPVYSTTSWPGRSRPLASAASIIARAIRSLYDPVGLAASIFTQTSASPSPAMCASRVTGVFPMAESPPGRSIPTTSSAKAASNSLGPPPRPQCRPHSPARFPHLPPPTAFHPPDGRE